MGLDVKKSVHFGNDGQHKAEITEEDKNPRSEEANRGKQLMEEAAKLFCPIGAKYTGAASVFYYTHPSLTEGSEQFSYACLVDVKQASEQVCDIGWKGLRTALMKCFGREVPKTVRN